jgi:arylsulfatase A-like enzyme
MPRARAPILAALCLAGCAGAPAPRLFLLVSVDTLRADRLGAYGSDRGLTPRIDALARESEVFRAAYAPASHTLPSVAALLTGRLPQEIGVVDNLSRLGMGVPTLASELASRGFSTAAVVSNWVLRRASGLDAGFAVYDDRLPHREAAREVPERVASDTTDAALRLVGDCAAAPERRCLVWVHYQDPHGPYTPPGGRERHLARERAEADGRRLLPLLPGPFGAGGIPSYQAVGDEREVAFYRAGYDAEVAYLDAEIGRLLDGVRERGLWERAVVVVTADHGESLGENDYWFGHGEDLSEALVRVPLLLRVPGRAPRERSDVASLVDLYRTLLALATGEPAPPGERGRDLLAAQAPQGASRPLLATLGGASVPRYGLVEGEFKYVVVRQDEAWRGRLYRRGDDATDLSAPASHVARAMRSRLEQLLESIPEPARAAERPLDDAERASLRALGYLAE